jgi:integrase
MPRPVRNRKLDSREARGRLTVRGAPYYCSVDQRNSVGYRRLKGKPGTWIWRRYAGDQTYEWEPLGVADDQSPADGIGILTFWQAQDRARERMAESAKAGTGADVTVAEALEQYAADLKTRDGGADNVARLRPHLDDELLARPIALLTSDELKRWRDSLRRRMARASVNRTCGALRAALNLAADGIKGQDRDAWQTGLKGIPGNTESEARNHTLPENHIRRLIREAGAEGEGFALFVATAAQTGARPSQISRLLVRDVEVDKLQMPSSKKGRGEKRIPRREVPISRDLANRLRAYARGKTPDAVLLTKPDGTPWQRTEHDKRFRRTVERAHVDPETTIYSLRHSSIMRQIAGGIPLHAVAVLHDTSSEMIAKTYGRRIDRHIDEMARKTLIEIDQAPDTSRKVVSI